MHVKFINEKKYHRLLYAFMILTCLLFANMSVYAQGLQVSGVVSDENGEALPGVNVVVKGTTTGMVTDAKGNYSITVPGSDAVLQFTFVGYNPQEITVGNQQVITVTMAESSTAIDEVVVIGYGTARRSDVTGSIVSVGQEIIREVPSANVMNALQGRMAGVEMSVTGNRPGDNMQIRIRGTRSLTASNDPLIVLDGIPFPGNISDINPSDIQSIDILKDASSTAIYGSRGANGVILITTDKRTVGKPRVTYDGYAGITTMFSRFPMMNGPEFVKYRTDAQANNSDYAAWSVSDDQTLDNDWQKLVLKNGYTTSHSLSVSAPTEGGSYSFGASYYKTNGIQPIQSYDRISLRGGFDQQIGKILRIGMTTQNSFSITNGFNINIMYGLLQTNPTLPAYNADGSVRKEQYSLSASSADVNWNPLMYLTNDDERIDQRKAFASYNSAYAEVKIWDGLKYRINLGGNFRNYNDGSFTTGQPGIWSGALTVQNAGASIGNNHNFNWAVEHLLYYDKVFGKHSVNAVAMYSAEQTTSYGSSASASGITVDQIQYFNLGLNSNGVTINPANQSYSLRGLISYMGRIAYAYDSRYMLSVTFRSDASSVLSKGNKWHSYPAISAGWNISKEEFMQGFDWLTFMKLRAGYGQTSNQSVDPYGTYGTMSAAYYTIGGSSAIQGFIPNAVPNPNLGWEYSETYNFGLDFSLFNSRISGTIEYYTVSTKDLLLSMQLPSSSGISSRYTTNIGATENKGFELSLNGTIIKNNNGFTWTAGVNLYTNKNKIVKLAGESTRDVGNNWFVGESINSIYEYKKLGIFQLDEELSAPGYYTGARPGTIKIAYNTTSVDEGGGGDVTFDANGSPSRMITGNDRYIIGSTDAKFQGGFNTTLRYKNIDLGIVGAFRHGGLLVSLMHSPNSYLNMLSGRRGQIKVDYWMPDNPTNAYPMAGGGFIVRGQGERANGDSPSFGSTLAYFDGSYLKIRSINLGYTLKPEWLKPVGLSNVRIYVSVNNPFVMCSPYHKETGIDPEPNTYADTRGTTASNSGIIPRRFLGIGYDVPSTRSYILGLNVSF